MAGKIAALFGGKPQRDPDPQAGEGGYTIPRGPYGATGMPGSTSAAPPVHSQTPGDGDKQELLTASGNQEEWLETRGSVGGMPGRYVGGQQARTRDTVKRRTPVISSGTPGAENVRNEVAQSYRNPPGQEHVYQSAPNPVAPPEPIVVDNRYLYDLGGYETHEVEREIPYPFIHARPPGYAGVGSVRGADLSGDRFYKPGTKNFLTTEGSYGVSRRRGPNHRPTTFTQPGPWHANYYDTSDTTVQQGQPNMVYESPAPVRSSVNRKRRRG